MQQPHLTSRTVDPRQLSPSERQAWADLSSSLPSLRTPYLAPAYVESVASVRPHVRVTVLYRSGQPTAFFPFQHASWFHRLMGVAEPAGSYMAGYAGLIAPPGFSIDPGQLLVLTGLSYALFPYLRQDQLAHGLTTDESARGHFIRLDQGPEKYWEDAKANDKKFVSEIARRRRQLTAQYGELRFCFAETDWQSALEHIMRKKSEQYVRTGRKDLFAYSWHRDLLFKLAATRESTCSGVLSTLYAGDVWVASHFGLRHSSALSFYFPVYNADLHRFSPGHQLLKEIIDASAAQGITLIDRCAGDTQAKRDFANDSHLIHKAAWALPGPRSFAYRAGLSLHWRLDGRLHRAASLPNHMEETGSRA